MGDVSLKRPIKAEPASGGISKGNRILDSMSAGWTDERHMLYISSMEASFVEQLHGYGHHTLNANQNNLNGNGFKVFRGGIWENLRFERTNARAHNGAKCYLSANPWIQHFRPRSCGGSACSDGGEALVNDHESGTHTIRGRIRSHGRELKVCRGENLVDESTEVSDQNFANEEVEVDAESSKACKKRRSSSTSTTGPNA